MQSNGVILWEGVSRIDGKTPVVCILTGLTRNGSRNTKTGTMLQTWILRADMAPGVAVTARLDVGLCGPCIHRKQANGKRSCYVNVWQGPNAIYKAYRNGSYARVTSSTTVQALVAGRAIRFGAYGDPAAVPVAVWRTLARAATGHTGYTHQWRSAKFAALAPYCQASCDSVADVALARAKGFRGAFLVVPQGADVPADALHCPASVERGKLTQCASCLACNGAGAALVAIQAHGAGARNYAPRPGRVLAVVS